MVDSQLSNNRYMMVPLRSKIKYTTSHGEIVDAILDKINREKVVGLTVFRTHSQQKFLNVPHHQDSRKLNTWREKTVSMDTKSTKYQKNDLSKKNIKKQFKKFVSKS